MPRPLLLLLVLLLAACSSAPPVVPDRPAAPAASSRPAARASQGGAPTEATRDLLAAHNEHRARHCAPPLEWSAEVAQVAQRWADQLQGRCALVHSKGSGYGENLWAGTAGAYSPRAVVDSWYREVASYQYQPGGFSMATGHFTQVVWLNSRRLGCARTTCQNLEIWVCNYDPPGNYQGQFPRQVLPPTCTR